MAERTSLRYRRMLTMATIAAGLLSITACSTPTGSDEIEVELTDRAPSATESVSEITWNLSDGEPATLDPRDSATYSSATVVANLCDPLLAIDEDYTLHANLVSFEAPDPLTLVYTIEAKATFWDGRPVTADDIVYSLDRAADPAAITAFLFANVADVEKTDDATVTVRFAQPDAMFNAQMATFAGAVVERSFAETAGASFGTAAGGIMCSGPYTLDQWRPGSDITIERNPDYWNTELPLLVERAKFTFITDSTAASQALSTGEIDGAYRIDPSAVPTLGAASNGQLFFGPSMESLQLYVARADGPLADVALRDALQKAIDREALAMTVYSGAAAPLYATVTPRTWPTAQHELYQDAYDKWAAARTFDPEAAKKLVEGSGYGGETLVLGVPAGQATLSRVAQLVQQQAEAVGVQIEIKDLQPLDYATASYDTVTRERFGLDLLLGESFNATAEPLEPLGFTLTEGAPYNYTQIADPELATLLERARAAVDPEDRARLVIEAQEIGEATSAAIPLLSLHTTTFLNSRLGGAITSFAYMSMPSVAYLGGTGGGE